MSGMIGGPMGPSENPEHLNFESLQGGRNREDGAKDEEKEREQAEARLDALGIDSRSYSLDQQRQIIRELRDALVASSTPQDFLGNLLQHYGFDLSKRNLPPGAITLVINGVIRSVLLAKHTTQSARDAVEAILRKHQVADRNPFGL